MAGTEGGNTAGLLERWWTWGWGEREWAPRPSPPPDQRQGGSFAYENEVLAPSSGPARVKGLFHLNARKGWEPSRCFLWEHLCFPNPETHRIG